MIREVAEERLSPPLRMRLAAAVVEVLVLRDAVVEAAVIEGKRDVVLDSSVRLRHARQPQVLPVGRVVLVSVIHDRVIDRIQTDHAFVNIGAGEIHLVVVEPEEGLFLVVVVAGRVVQIQVVDEHAGLVGRWHVVRVAVALRRRVAVVEVRQERRVGRAEVIAIESERILVEVILEPNERRLAVRGVDHRSGEGAVEPVDRAGRCDLRPEARIAECPVQGCHRSSVRFDRQQSRRRERMLPYLQLDPVQERIR